MEAASNLVAALAALGAVRPRVLTATDDELLADLDAGEAIGRLVEALRISAAAQVELRSSKALGESSLAFHSDAKDGIDLVAQVTRVGEREAKRRVGLGSALAPRRSLTGEALPSAYPVLTEAVAAGTVGVEAARVIVDAALSIPKRVQGAEVIEKMVKALTDTAAADSFEMLRDVAARWVELLHPDEAKPAEAEQRRKRALRMGFTGTDGTTPFSGIFTAEHPGHRPFEHFLDVVKAWPGIYWQCYRWCACRSGALSAGWSRSSCVKAGAALPDPRRRCASVVSLASKAVASGHGQPLPAGLCSPAPRRVLLHVVPMLPSCAASRPISMAFE